MEIETFLKLAEEWGNMGWAVQEQLKEIIQGADLEEQNANALKMIQGFLKRAENAGIENAEYLTKEIKGYLAEEATA